MALLTATLTIAAGAGGNNLATVGSANGVALGNKGILYMLIATPAHTITYGPQVSGSFTTTPATGAASATITIGPFSGSAPTRTSEWYFKGTTNDVITFTIITQ